MEGVRTARSSRPGAVVTGASAGGGRATRIALAGAGDDVGLLAHGEARVRAAADDVMAAGGRALAVEADVAAWADMRQAGHAVEAQLGPWVVRWRRPSGIGLES